MKKYLIILLVFIAIQKLAFAAPVIENISANPQSLWLGENTIISLNCYDNENKTITSTYADIVGPGIVLPRLYFTGNNLLVDSDYLDRAGQYYATLFCNNSDNQSYSTSTNFAVSRLTGYISNINPNPGYIGNEIEIDFLTKLNDATPLTSGVSFQVYLNDQLKSLKILPAYDTTKGWMLKLDSPSTEGVYNIKVYAFYDRTSAVNTSSIEIRKEIDFGISSLSQNWVEGNENITIGIRAKDKGNIIDVNKNNLNIQIASTNLNVIRINRNGDLYNVFVTTPDIGAGIYNILATLNYNGNYYSDLEEIDYVVNVSGKIVDNNNNGISTQMNFISNGEEKLRVQTDNTGYYSDSLPPNTYDIQITFPQSTLYLKEVPVSNFNDPIKYFYSTDYLVPGIRNAGLFSYKVDLTYYEADLEMNYNEKNIFDSSNIVMYKCSSWNSGKKICNNNWFQVFGEIDTTRDLVKINSTSLSAFIIGERKGINANFNLDSQSYYSGSSIKVRGFLKDSDGDIVPNATIRAYVKNTNIGLSTASDNNGVFSFELRAPDNEGNYTLILNSEKSPYISSNDSISFSTFKSREMTIVTPDTIKLKQGQNSTQEFSITNVGQADLFDLNISLTGIPSNYYNMTDYIGRLKHSEEAKIYVQFTIPQDADNKTYSVDLEVFNNEIKQDKIFGFTIGKNETVTSVTQNPVSPAGNFILPNLDFNFIYITIFAIFCFSIAAVLKKIKIKKSKRDDIKVFLFDVKNYLGKGKSEVITNFRNQNNYKKIIASAFPNIKKDAEDEYGKNN